MLQREFEKNIIIEAGIKWLVFSQTDGAEIIQYQVNMLAHNKMEGIAPLHIRVKNEQTLFYYEIGEGRSLSELAESMPAEELVSFLAKVAEVIGESSRLLLEEGRFLLEEDLVYAGPCGDPCLLYYPVSMANNPGQDFTGFVENLLAKNMEKVTPGVVQLLLEGLAGPAPGLSAFRAAASKCRSICPAKNSYRPDEPCNDREQRVSGLSCDTNSDRSHINRQKASSSRHKLKTITFVILVEIAMASLAAIAWKLLGRAGAAPALRYPLLPGIGVLFNLILYKAVSGGIIREVAQGEGNNLCIKDKDYHEAQSDIIPVPGEESEVFTGWGSLTEEGKAIERQPETEVYQPVCSENDRPDTERGLESTLLYSFSRGESESMGDSSFSRGEPESMTSCSFSWGKPGDMGALNEYSDKKVFTAETTLLCEPLRKAAFSKSMTSLEDGIEFTKSRFIIGRNPDACDLVIPVKTVGRIHAEVIRKENEYYLVDRDSKNGTYLNGQKLAGGAESRLSSGDSVLFSEESYYFIV